MVDEFRVRTRDIETRSVEGELVLLDLRSQTYLSLNRTGSELWPLLHGGTSRQTLIDELRNRYDITEETAMHDVDSLVEQLSRADLLDRDDGETLSDAS
jgi:Coenzyme PQQ synthesis protein D (PqqD)